MSTCPSDDTSPGSATTCPIGANGPRSRRMSSAVKMRGVAGEAAVSRNGHGPGILIASGRGEPAAHPRL